MANLPHDYANTSSQSQHLLPKPPEHVSGSYSNSPSPEQTELRDEVPGPSPNAAVIDEEIGGIPPCRQSPPLVWAVTIIGEQLIILAFAWAFFAAVYYNGPIALPDEKATNLKAAKAQRTVTLIVTLVATALSLASALYVHYMISMVLCFNFSPVCSGVL